MASSEEKNRKKLEAEKERELREAGNVPHWSNFHLDSGRRVRTAWAWIPRLRLVILGSLGLSVFMLVATLLAVYSRPQAMLFLALPDGSIACAPMSTPTGAPLRRPPEQQAVCDRLVPPVGFDRNVQEGRQ